MQPLKQLFVALVVPLWASTVLATDLPHQDGDGIPDVIEPKLGTPQNVPQILQPIASVAQQMHFAGSTLGLLQDWKNSK